jgi:hypothetical protein
MKLTVEIKDDRFIYHYKVAENEHNSSSHLSADLLIAFTELLRHCSQAAHANHDQRMRAITAGAWIEQHPDEARKKLESFSKSKGDE